MRTEKLTLPRDRSDCAMSTLPRHLGGIQCHAGGLLARMVTGSRPDRDRLAAVTAAMAPDVRTPAQCAAPKGCGNFGPGPGAAPGGCCTGRSGRYSCSGGGAGNQADPRGFDRAVRRALERPAKVEERLMPKVSQLKTASQIAAEELADPEIRRGRERTRAGARGRHARHRLPDRPRIVAEQAGAAEGKRRPVRKPFVLARSLPDLVT